MKKMARILYRYYGANKVFTFDYTPKEVIPEITGGLLKDTTIDGNSRFITSKHKYNVKISTFLSERSLAELYTITALVKDTIYYEVDGNVFEGREPKNKIAGRLSIIGITPPQKSSHSLYKVECEFYEA